MSQFYSDMITWAVVGLTAGAVVLGNLPGSAPEPDLGVAEVTSADSPETRVVLAAADTAQVIEPAQVERVTRAAVPLPQIVDDAVLMEVNFTSNGADLGLPQVAGSDLDAGRVTGQSVNLRAGPGTGFEIVSRAAFNDELFVTGESQGIWVQVLLPITEQEAWIHGNYFDAPGV